MDIREYFGGAEWKYKEMDEIKLKVEALMLAQGLDDGEIGRLSETYKEEFLPSNTICNKISRSLLSKGLLQSSCYEGQESSFMYCVTYPLGYEVIRALHVDIEPKLE